MLPPNSSRRDFLRSTACGFGSLALASLLSDTARGASNPLAPRPPHFPPRAKRVIFLFMQGGPSQIDLFDFKPRLVADHGKPIPFAIPKDMAEDGIENSKILRPVADIRPVRVRTVNDRNDPRHQGRGPEAVRLHARL